MEGDMTPITADMLDETPMSEPQCGEPEQPEQVEGASMNGHQAESSPTVAEAIAERELKAILEAMLFVSPEPLASVRIVAALGDVTKAEVERVLRVLGDDLEQEGRGVRLAEIAGGFRLVTKPEYSSWVKRLDKAKSTAKLSRSALESLAIIAYKQPIVRSEIEEIRGVETSGVVRTLLERKMVRIVGRKEVPGRPIMYGTTKYFLEHFGLNDLSQLPPLREFKELGEADQSLLPLEGDASPEAGTSTNEAVSAVSMEAPSSLAEEGMVEERTELNESDQAASDAMVDTCGQESAGHLERNEIGAVGVEEAVEERIEETVTDEIAQIELDDTVTFSTEGDQPANELTADEARKIDEELFGEPVEQ
jgi:segregation and condensation protein B